MCICGRENCNGLCEEAVGSRVMEFLHSSSMMDTDIGEYVQKSEKSTDYFIVTGTQHYSSVDGVSVSRIMKDSEKVECIKKESLFNGGQPKVIKVLTAYEKASGKQATDEKAQIRGLFSYRKVFEPIKTGKFLDIDVALLVESLSKRKGDFKKCEVHSTRWSINNQGFIEGTLMCRPDYDKAKIYTVGIENYGDIYRYGDVLDPKDTSIKRLIKMSKFGYFCPLTITNGEYKVTIDNTSMYITEDGETKEVGVWDGNSLKCIELVSDKKIKALLNSGKNYLAVHRKSMAPYTIGTENVVDIKTK